MTRSQHIFLVGVAVLGTASVVQIFRATQKRQQAEVTLHALNESGGVPRVKMDDRDVTQKLSVAATSRESSPIPQHAKSETVETPATEKPDASKLLAANPEAYALFEKAFHARFDAEYRRFFDLLVLPPDRVERFKARLFRDKVDQLDLRWTGVAQGATRGDSAYQALRRQQEEALRVDLQQIVGPDGLNALDNFRRANGVRDFVEELARGMLVNGRGMTLDQQDQLVQVIAEQSARFQQGGQAMPWDANWDVIMQKAPAFLTDAQLAALREDGDQHVRFVWMLPRFYAQHRPDGK
jgi:hypothetical protein